MATQNEAAPKTKILIAGDGDMAADDDIVNIVTILVGHASQGTEQHRLAFGIDGRIIVSVPIDIKPRIAAFVVEARAVGVVAPVLLGVAPFGGASGRVPFDVGHRAQRVGAPRERVCHNSILHHHGCMSKLSDSGVFSLNFDG